MQWSTATYPSPDQSGEPTTPTPLETMVNEFSPILPMPQSLSQSQGFEYWFTCVSGFGTISLNKTLLSLLQTPVHVSLGFDVRRHIDPLLFMNSPKENRKVERGYICLCALAGTSIFFCPQTSDSRPWSSCFLSPLIQTRTYAID